MSQTMGGDELVLAIATTEDWLHAGTVAEVLAGAQFNLQCTARNIAAALKLGMDLRR